jgi:uncharacterized phage protein (TIGR02220 family)
MWTKPGFLRLPSDARLVYSFLITGPDSNLTGIVRYPIDMVSMCTGLPPRSCETALGDLVDAGRIAWDADSGIIFVIRWLKHNPLNSPKLVAGYVKYLEAFDGHQFAAYAARLLKHADYDRLSIEYRRGIDTLQGQGQGQDSPVLSPVPVKTPHTPRSAGGAPAGWDEAVNRRQVLSTVVCYLNQKAGTKFSAAAKPTVRLIEARMAEGRTLDDFKAVIDDRCSAWLADEKMRQYLRPETLFNATKMESYLGVIRSKPTEIDYPEMPEV